MRGGEVSQRRSHAFLGDTAGQPQRPAHVQAVHQQVGKWRFGTCARRAEPCLGPLTQDGDDLLDGPASLLARQSFVRPIEAAAARQHGQEELRDAHDERRDQVRGHIMDGPLLAETPRRKPLASEACEEVSNLSTLLGDLREDIHDVILTPATREDVLSDNPSQSNDA